MPSNFNNKSILVTGGAGFIGSHITDKLMEDEPSLVLVLDNLESSDKRYIQQYLSEPNFQFVKDDIMNINQLDFPNIDIIIHLAAQPSVPISVEKPYYDFKINVQGSMQILEFARKNDVGHVVFAASGGTVYGEAEKIPTPEDYQLRPISNYGAAKAAVEMYLGSYAELYDMKTTSMRFGNIYGERSSHGVMYDFYHKLQQDPEKLEILGNGKQTKSYLYIEDCVQGFLKASLRDTYGFLPINMAANPPKTVDDIADEVSRVLDLSPKYHYTGGERGWKGDVRKGELDCTRLKSLGWDQKISFEEGVKRFIEWLERENE